MGTENSVKPHPVPTRSVSNDLSWVRSLLTQLLLREGHHWSNKGWSSRSQRESCHSVAYPQRARQGVGVGGCCQRVTRWSLQVHCLPFIERIAKILKMLLAVWIGRSGMEPWWHCEKWSRREVHPVAWKVDTTAFPYVNALAKPFSCSIDSATSFPTRLVLGEYNTG